jgi:structural maintenance of chromosome 2
MVEEAAGTRMFEERKDKAKKTISKKEKRVAEIRETLDMDIGPKLAKLRKDKAAYIEWQTACSELERIGRVLKAWEWVSMGQRVETKGQAMEDKKQEAAQIKESKERAAKEEKAAKKQAGEVVKRKEEEMKKGGKLSLLQEQVGEMDKEVEKIRTRVGIKEKDVRDEKDKVVKIMGDGVEVICICPHSSCHLIPLTRPNPLSTMQKLLSQISHLPTKKPNKHTILPLKNSVPMRNYFKLS